ncbi:MAG: hypothetical protein HP495_08455 [Nitrospira sp.]|nr:hypothetical protein [Nitrospira sp.]
MELHHLKSILGALGLVLAVLIGPPAFAHEDRAPTGSWEGVARSSTVSLPTLLTFGADGNLVESRRLYFPQSPLGPLLATLGHGEWRRSKNDRFEATIVLLYQGAPDHPTSPGVVIGKEKVRYQFQLIHGGEQLQGTILVEIHDTAGNIVFSGPGTIEATRIRLQSLP